MRGDITQRLIETDELVGQAGIPILDVPWVTVGSVLGSFTLFDILRIYGVPGATLVRGSGIVASRALHG